jgi:NitT/TauT family transport system ATP-binding protein
MAARMSARATDLADAGDDVVVERLYKSYGDEFSAKMAVADCSLTAARGRFTVLVGPSGCGKTSLVNLIAGYERATRGRIVVAGSEVVGPDAERLVVFQETALFPWMNVLDNVMYGPRVQRRIPVAQARADAEALLAKVGLAEFRDKCPNQLSGGMQRRAELARALINRPRVLLMDEPFGALDAQTRSRMQAHLLEIWRKIDITIIFITHDLDEAIFLADRILVLSAHPGEVQELIEVPVPRPRSLSQSLTPEFLATKARLEELIYASRRHGEEQEDYPILGRMTDVTDNVE